MQVNISGHQLEVTKPLREYTESKLNKLAGHFDKITNVQVIMEVDKLKQKIEATLHVPNAKLVANAVRGNRLALRQARPPTHKA